MTWMDLSGEVPGFYNAGNGEPLKLSRQERSDRWAAM